MRVDAVTEAALVEGLIRVRGDRGVHPELRVEEEGLGSLPHQPTKEALAQPEVRCHVAHELGSELRLVADEHELLAALRVMGNG